MAVVRFRSACDLVEASQPLMSRAEEKRFRSGLARARATANAIRTALA